MEFKRKIYPAYFEKEEKMAKIELPKHENIRKLGELEKYKYMGI